MNLFKLKKTPNLNFVWNDQCQKHVWKAASVVQRLRHRAPVREIPGSNPH